VRLTVLSLFGRATYQDAGRPGWRHFGVPTGGWLDEDAALVARALCGNGPDAPTVEGQGARMVLRAESDGAVAVVGAAAPVGRVWVRAGEEVVIEPSRSAAVWSLAAPGGWVCERVLGSASGTPIGHALVAAGPPGRVPGLRPTWRADSGEVRVVGATWEGGLEATVDVASDRAATRLVPSRPLPQFLGGSRPAVRGAIEATPDGNLLVIGPDGPTVGGYPFVGHVCRVDRGVLARLPAGSSVALRAVSVDEARQAWASAIADRERTLAQLASVAGVAETK
jgi:5-oxoprolinase (ATP-hydrolysing) subunit C